MITLFVISGHRSVIGFDPPLSFSSASPRYVNCRNSRGNGEPPLSKRAIRIPSAREGRGVRWTLEVSADAGKGAARAPKPSAKQASSTGAKKSQPAASAPRVSKKRVPPTGLPKTSVPKTSSRAADLPVPAMAPLASAATATPLPGSSTKTITTSRTRPRAERTTARRMLVVAASTVLVIATLAVTGYPSRSVASKPVQAQPDLSAAPAVHTVATQPEVPPTPPAEPAAAAPATVMHLPPVVIEQPRQTQFVANRTSARPPIVWPPPAPAATPVEPGEPAAVPAGPDPAASTPPAESTPALAGVNQAPVTITGCLETAADEDRFRLTDTVGADAPKARGWRSGFLKKRSAPVELLQLSDVKALRPLVGHRVVATGLLTNRELHVSSLQPAGHSCD